jgi:hypothetical protein
MRRPLGNLIRFEMVDLQFYEYSIEALKSFFEKETNTPLQNLETKIHLTYFEEYFRVLGAQSIIVESPYIDHDYLEDFSAYYVKCFNLYNRFCKRLHFFNKNLSSKEFDEILLSGNKKQELDGLNDAYLGFIVVKPIPATFIGRTCLKTYPEVDGRKFSFTHKYEVNISGINLTVESLAYQEQDSIVAACASTSIWTAFQATAFLFQHYIPTPVEITKAAVKYFPFSNRNFPNKGLSGEQMAQAIRDVGLEPYLVLASTPDIIKATVFAYQKAGIPLILGFKFEEEKIYDGKHAVTITGYKLDGRKSAFPGSSFHLFSSRMSKIYAHDDQIGPFARMKFVEDYNKFETSWPDENYNIGNIHALPFILLIPLYSKLRIPFELILSIISKFDEILDIVNSKINFRIDEIEWEIFLSKSNQVKTEVFNSDLEKEEKLKILKKSLPRYVWRAIAHLNGEKVELIFDTTDIEQGNIFICLINQSQDLLQIIKTIADNIDLGAIKSIPLQSIFKNIRKNK